MGRNGTANDLHTLQGQELVPGSPDCGLPSGAITLKVGQAQVKPEASWKQKPVGAMLGAEVVVCRSLATNLCTVLILPQKAIRHARTVHDSKQPETSQHRNSC